MNLPELILDLVFPPKCPFCEVVLDEPRAPLCPVCQPILPWLDEKDAFRRVDHTAGCWSPLEYRDGVRDCIHRYKFSPISAYGKPLGQLVAQCVRDHEEIQPALITWTPLSRRSLKKRGFDQAHLLAEAVGQELGLPVEPVLTKVRETQQQSSLSDFAQRRANTRGAYEVSTKSAVMGKHILLVDDVVTSGSTLSSCAQVLKQAGAAEVWCATLAQAGK